jgi:hypothetical protein
MSDNLSQKHLYEGVKSIIETNHQHLHFYQHKLFTLFSLAFQFYLYKSTKEPGIYLIRVEDRHLADKLARKAKDADTRKFFCQLLPHGRLKFKSSSFYLDYFQTSSWKQTCSLDPQKIKGSLIVKNTSRNPMEHEYLSDENEAEKQNFQQQLYYTTLRGIAAHSIVIAYESEFTESHKWDFPFIQRDEERALAGVKLSQNFKLETTDSED